MIGMSIRTRSAKVKKTWQKARGERFYTWSRGYTNTAFLLMVYGMMIRMLSKPGQMSSAALTVSFGYNGKDLATGCLASKEFKNRLRVFGGLE